MNPTIIQQIDKNLWIKREDLIPFSFGGNKARKAFLFFEDYDKSGCDCVVTYGSSSSNHCRVIANICASRNIPCYIISPLESSEETFNSKLIKLFGAKITIVPVEKVKSTIESIIKQLRENNKKPYFIQGGGHGNIGTQAYVDCYNEIIEWEKTNNIKFDYIFFASGTGTTQAGLVCGQIINKDNKKIVGISVARKLPRGRDIIIDSIKEYLKDCSDFEDKVIFLDDYVGEGYGKKNAQIKKTINDAMIKYGIPFDATYTAKAFYGMKDYLDKNGIENKNVLFIHTGGTPLFFNGLE